MPNAGDAVRPESGRRAAFAFIIVTVFLDVLAIGIVVPVLPGLVVGFTGGDVARGADWLGIFGAAWALMQFVFSPVQGSLSDRFGRRPVVIASNFGLGLDYVLMALAPNLWWLFAGRLISGATAASVSTSLAYVADVTAPNERAKVMGRLGAAMGLGFVLGPALGGFAGAFDPRLPFWIAAGLSLVNGLYGVHVLPESLPPERRTRFAWRAASPIGSLRLVRRSAQLIALSAVNFLGHFAHCVLPSVAVLYMAYRYGWGPSMVGLTMTAVGAGHVVVQGLLMAPAIARLGERGTLLLGLGFGSAGFLAAGLATTGTQFLLSIPLLSLWGFAGSALQGLMTREVGPHEQGQLQGANMSALGIANMIGPVLFAQAFALSVGRWQGLDVPGLAFAIAAALLALAALIVWRATR